MLPPGIGVAAVLRWLHPPSDCAARTRGVSRPPKIPPGRYGFDGAKAMECERPQQTCDSSSACGRSTFEVTMISVHSFAYEAPVTDTVANRLLAAVPEPTLARLLPELKLVSTSARQTLQRAGIPSEFVYFPTGGMFSLVTPLPDGTVVESAAVGNEGVIGFEQLLSDDAVAPCETIAQVPAPVLRLPVRVFLQELGRDGRLRLLIGRYAQFVLAQSMQAAACNAVHATRERCARWLLTAHDRVRQDRLRVTHDVLAAMLGTGRPTVTMAAGSLQQNGLIQYSHGMVTIADRDGLEAATCPCYGLMKVRYDRILAES
jgi:CRP-like cAMP-binding protein